MNVYQNAYINIKLTQLLYYLLLYFSTKRNKIFPDFAVILCIIFSINY